MKKLKVVQIGIGHAHATSAFNSLLRQPELFEVVEYDFVMDDYPYLLDKKIQPY